jgi:hypothetical protein
VCVCIVCICVCFLVYITVCLNVCMCVKLIELLKQLQVEREQNSETLKGEIALWEQNIKHVLKKMCFLRAKNVRSIHQVSNLEIS